jgi:hypothetical protein
VESFARLSVLAAIYRFSDVGRSFVYVHESSSRLFTLASFGLKRTETCLPTGSSRLAKSRASCSVEKFLDHVPEFPLPFKSSKL